MTETTTINTPNMNYSYETDGINRFNSKVTIKNDDGTSVTYEKTYGRSLFVGIIFDNMAKYATEESPDISNEEIFNFIEDVTLNCLSDQDRGYCASYDSYDRGQQIIGKNAYLETLNNLVELYTNEEYSEGGKNITPTEQNKIVESFIKHEAWNEVKPEETTEEKAEEKAEENKSGFNFWKWLGFQ